MAQRAAVSLPVLQDLGLNPAPLPDVLPFLQHVAEGLRHGRPCMLCIPRPDHFTW